MSKIEIYEKISDYIDGNMSDSDLKEFESKMNNDKSLAENVQNIKGLIKNIKNVQELKLPPNFESKLKRAVGDVGDSRTNVFRLFDRPIWIAASSVAAAVLLVVSVTILFLDERPSQLIEDGGGIAFDDNEDIDDMDVDFELKLHQAKSEKLQKPE